MKMVVQGTVVLRKYGMLLPESGDAPGGFRNKVSTGLLHSNLQDLAYRRVPYRTR